jgi:hypothetical protein
MPKPTVRQLTARRFAEHAATTAMNAITPKPALTFRLRKFWKT